MALICGCGGEITGPHDDGQYRCTRCNRGTKYVNGELVSGLPVIQTPWPPGEKGIYLGYPGERITI
jgi:hypothetical protein